MISQLHGIVFEASPSQVVIDVSGIGFELGISGITAAQLPALGDEVRLYTRMQVREDACTLFGFTTAEERTMFDRLVAVSGVGPRLALAVLSTFTTSQLYSIVMAEDDKNMATVPGVGKKTAKRLILELKSVFAKDKGFVPVDIGAVPVAAAASARSSSALDECREALLSMGFSPQEAELALDGYDGRDMRVEELLSSALKRLGMDA